MSSETSVHIQTIIQTSPCLDLHHSVYYHYIIYTYTILGKEHTYSLNKAKSLLPPPRMEVSFGGYMEPEVIRIIRYVDIPKTAAMGRLLVEV
jgi:hypothetical protein